MFGDPSDDESESNEDQLQRIWDCYPNQERGNVASSENVSFTGSEMSFFSESLWSSDDNGENGDMDSDISFSLWDDPLELEARMPRDESETSEQEIVQWEYPRSNWNVWRAWKERQNGLKANMSSDWFGYKAMGSLHFVRRLTAMKTLEAHDGCVNCLNFHPAGRLLISGSDDCRLILWDWALGKPLVTVPSGHTHNIFQVLIYCFSTSKITVFKFLLQAKFTSVLDDGGIVTSAYDGQVRYLKVSPDGSVNVSKQLVLHEEAAHSISMVSHNPNVILSCGSDGYVFEIDLREDEPKRLFCSSDVNGISYPLYSIAAHPRKPEEFAIAGLSNYVLFFDRRKNCWLHTAVCRLTCSTLLIPIMLHRSKVISDIAIFKQVLRSNARYRYRRNIMFTARGQIPSATGATAERVVRFRPPAVMREADIESPEWRQNGDFPPECHMSNSNHEKMTISYTNACSTVSLGNFLRLLFRWKGSVYKIIYKQALIFVVVYYSINLLYWQMLNNEQKIMFEKVAFYFSEANLSLPLTFLMGFFVSQVANRWISNFKEIVWIDSCMIRIASFVEGNDERGRLLRRTLARYVNLSCIIVLRDISTAVKKRFPTLDHLVKTGIITEEESHEYIISCKQHPDVYLFWLPIEWAINLVAKARKENRILCDLNMSRIIRVVTIATESYFLTNVIARQYTQNQNNTSLETVFPATLFLEFLFYVGWLKVAEVLIVPYGEDDDDFELAVQIFFIFFYATFTVYFIT
ncbi:bestrophin-1 [Trichinella spiralis]|uniref:bestrophin-1 n=1 Tax=Trichinella spiralis TaxID=6334 RepID=UPI0001EFCE27|nr:bestrophin-1 [Trichinella spiralis]